MALTTTFSSATTQNDQQSTPLGGATGKTSDVNESVDITLNEGTASGEANLTHQQTITLNAGNSYEVALDIFAGSLVNDFGATFNVKELKGVFFEVTTATALANCEVFADQDTPANEFKGPLNDVTGDGLTLETGQGSSFTNSGTGGWPVDATHKFLVFKNNNTTDTTINVMLVGVAI